MLSKQIHQLCFYKVASKSLPHFEDGVLVNPKGLDYCSYSESYIDKEGECDAGKDIKDVIEVYCKKCKKLLCQYKPVVGGDELRHIVDFRYTEFLLAVRKRDDGLFGLECVCGQSDTRLSKNEKDKEPHRYPPFIKSTNTDEATYGHSKSNFRYNKRREK